MGKVRGVRYGVIADAKCASKMLTESVMSFMTGTGIRTQTGRKVSRK